MIQLPNYGDERQLVGCIYCRRTSATRDHVPPRVFLDVPYPENLPVVPACRECNEALSLDEEYLACLVECALVGSVRVSEIRREKIRRILGNKPALAARLIQARKQTDNGTSFQIEAHRVKNVVVKLGRGHAAFELNEPQYQEPCVVSFQPLVALSSNARERFETPPRMSLLPEVGSRATQRLLLADSVCTDWIVAQPGRYRYLSSVGTGTTVRVVIGEYLACEMIWS